jgi:hypothetical protein
MEYKKKVQTVVEMPGYLKIAEALFSEVEREQIVAMVAADPECGEVMQGTGGFRKVRIARSAWASAAGREWFTSCATKHFRSSLLSHTPRTRRGI